MFFKQYRVTNLQHRGRVDHNGQRIAGRNSGDDAEEGENEKAGQRDEEEKVVQRVFHAARVEVQRGGLPKRKDRDHTGDEVKGQFRDVIDDQGRGRVFLRGNGDEKDDDTNDGADEDEDAGENAPVNKQHCNHQFIKPYVFI